MYVIKAAETTFVQKIRTFNVDEIDYKMERKTERKIKIKERY